MFVWLARTPDLSPIQHVWDMGRQLQYHLQPALTAPVLTQQVQQAWNSISQNDIRRLFETTLGGLLSKFLWSHRLVI
ncbi:transposable element Tc1 transposase [Trichonephila clavipes]|nr:transposable element Tc1 transposase [Trichonephila clavipes]